MERNPLHLAAGVAAYLILCMDGSACAQTITQIQNNYSYALPGYPNYGIAPSSLFIVQGSGLSNPAPAVLQSSAPPGLPLILNGASISVTVNGVTVQPGIYYATPTQIAAVLPSNTPVGTGTLTVTNSGSTSAPAAMLVTPNALGFDSFYGIGSGPAVATDALTGSLLTFTNPAKPGQTIVLWGSGLGADPSVSDTQYTVPTQNVSVPLQIYIGGLPAAIGYQGSSGYPGVNQINVTIPDSVAGGCAVSVVAISNDLVSNTVTLPVSADGSPCSDPLFGTNGATLASLGAQPTASIGTLTLIQLTAPIGAAPVNSATGTFEMSAGTAYGATSTYGSLGNCVLRPNPMVNAFASTGLDAGLIALTGPMGSYSLPQTAPGTYQSSLTADAIPSSGASFTFQGSGGANVGAFSTTVNVANPPFTWTNPSDAAIIDRTVGLTVNWTGGAPGSAVVIFGVSSLPVVPGYQPVLVEYSCYASADAGQFTVAPYILLGLPVSNLGSTQVENVTAFQPFTAAGLDLGFAFAITSYLGFSVYK